MLKTVFEKIIFALFLTSFLLFVIIKALDSSSIRLWAILGLISLSLPIILTLLYLVTTKFSAWSILLAIYLLSFAAGLLKILHLPGADLLMSLGFFIYPVVGLTLLIHANKKGHFSNLSQNPYLPITSILLVFDFVFSILVREYEISNIGRPILLFGQLLITITLLHSFFKKVTFYPPISRVLALALIYSIIGIGGAFTLILEQLKLVALNLQL